MASRFWLLPMTGGVRSIGWADFNNRLHSDRFSAASRLRTGARAGRYMLEPVLNRQVQRSPKSTTQVPD